MPLAKRAILSLWAIAPAMLLAGLLSALGITPVREDTRSSATEASLVDDYLAFEALLSPSLQQDGLNAAYGQMAQDVAPTRELRASGRDSLQSTGAQATIRAADLAAASLGATERLAPARALYRQVVADIGKAWTTEQAAEGEWRAARFPPDPTGMRQGSAAHPLIWYRSVSSTSLGDAVKLMWQAHQLVLGVAAMHRVAPPESHIPMAPWPLFRGVQ